MSLLNSSLGSYIATFCMIVVGQGTTNSNPRFKHQAFVDTPTLLCEGVKSRCFPFIPCLLLNSGFATDHTTPDMLFINTA